MYPLEDEIDTANDNEYSDTRNHREKVTRNIFQNPPRNTYRNQQELGFISHIYFISGSWCDLSTTAPLRFIIVNICLYASMLIF